MFFTLIQEPINGEYLSERFICFEASSMEDAMEQAAWFGIDLEEKIGQEEDYDGYCRWWWATYYGATPQPQIPGVPMLRDRNRFTNHRWVIVYKNGNLCSSEGDALDFEIRRQPAEDL